MAAGIGEQDGNRTIYRFLCSLAPVSMSDQRLLVVASRLVPSDANSHWCPMRKKLVLSTVFNYVEYVELEGLCVIDVTTGFGGKTWMVNAFDNQLKWHVCVVV